MLCTWYACGFSMLLACRESNRIRHRHSGLQGAYGQPNWPQRLGLLAPRWWQQDETKIDHRTICINVNHNSYTSSIKIKRIHINTSIHPQFAMHWNVWKFESYWIYWNILKLSFHHNKFTVNKNVSPHLLYDLLNGGPRVYRTELGIWLQHRLILSGHFRSTGFIAFLIPSDGS